MSAPSRGCPTRRERLHPRFVLGNVSVLPEKPAWGKDLLGRTLWQAPGCWSSSEDAWRRPDPATERPKNKLTEEISVTRGQGTATVSVMVKSPHLDGTRGVGLRGSSALLCENHWRWTTLGHFFSFFFFFNTYLAPKHYEQQQQQKDEVCKSRAITVSASELRCFPNAHLDDVNHPSGKHFRPGRRLQAGRAASSPARSINPAGLHP